MPPEDAVPREMKKITLPPYVIEAPDQLLIEVVQRTKITEFDPVTGEELETTAKEVISQPPEVIDRLKKVLGN